MRLNRIYVIALLMWGLVSSCISEDYSDCFNRYVIDLSYKGDGEEEIFGSCIDKVDMYILDKDDICIYKTALTESEISRQNTTLPLLEAGDYRLVFIGNTYSTAVRGLKTKSLLSDMYFGAESYFNGQETSGNDPLYFASVMQRVEPFASERQITYQTAYFASSHYDVSVEVVGVPSAPRIILTGVSPHTDFNNVAAADIEAEYVLEAIHDGGSKAMAECNIFRHLDHGNVYLKVLTHDGIELASVNFNDFLLEHAQYIDCSRQEVLIPFKVELKSAEVHVGLPDWVVVDTEPDWN